MNVGICGMGKLGLPVALAIESRGHEVMGYDISRPRMDILSARNTLSRRRATAITR